jgi:hypothetical protein
MVTRIKLGSSLMLLPHAEKLLGYVGGGRAMARLKGKLRTEVRVQSPVDGVKFHTVLTTDDCLLFTD